MKIAIFTKDRYGIGFLKSVINRLISEEHVKKVEFAKPHTHSSTSVTIYVKLNPLLEMSIEFW